jgi:hypothetical protein
MASVSFGFTVCESAQPGLIAAKRISPGKTHAYGMIALWRFESVIETSHEAMAERLKALALQPSRMIVMGEPIPGLDLRHPHRRRWAGAGTATLCGPDRAWLPLDFDDVPMPKGLGRAERLAEAALFVRDRLLPEEFRDARMVAAPTAGTGRKGDSIARLRLFVALDRPHALAAMKAWANGAPVALELPIDSSVIQVGQPVYTARPVFDGVTDPVPRGLHALVLDGDRDVVRLAVDRFAPKVAAIEARVARIARACGSNWRKLLDDTLGGDEGFFVPLTRAVGVAVRAGAAPAEIQEVVAALLARRADAGRRAQYGPSWIDGTIRSFERRDAVTRTACKRALSRLFLNEA